MTVGSGSSGGCHSCENSEHTIATAATGTISRHRRRVDSETSASIDGPAADADTVEATLVAIATATGYLRRQCTAINDSTPRSRSAANHHLAYCHW
ncbi:hypothetical protein GCM10009855_20190 [Gordonia cholesterolivorans]|uniref:Uncharacterized protein n=1 Tax=Gordonia cholesterolivorans TaxID=559625 RepID=A0ABN3HH39_9ACTN